MRFLERRDVRLERVDHRAGLGYVPVLALVIELGFVAPEAQDDVECLARHLAVLARIAVDVEHRPVAGQAARRHAEVEPTLREMVEHRDPVGELGRMMVRHQEPAGADAHARGLHQRLGHEQVGRGVRLPGRGVVLADPRFAEAELVGPAELLEIPLMPVVQAALGRVRWHREQSVVHVSLLGAIPPTYPTLPAPRPTPVPSRAHAHHSLGPSSV